MQVKRAMQSVFQTFRQVAGSGLLPEGSARHHGSLLVILLASCLVYSPQLSALEIRKAEPAIASPELALKDLKGRTHTLDEYAGKVVMVNFWASWCPPCIEEMPAMERLQQDLRKHPFEILALNVGEKKYRVHRFVKLVGFGLPVLLDAKKETSRTWHARILPTTFLIDSKGMVRYRIQGNPDWDAPETRALISALIDEATQPSKDDSE